MNIENTRNTLNANAEFLQEIQGSFGGMDLVNSQGLDLLSNMGHISYSSPMVTGMALQFALLIIGIYASVFLFFLIISWKIFTRAWRPGWYSLIPIYNIVVLLEIVGAPIWWIFLLCIPLVNLFVCMSLYIRLARVFGRGSGFALGMMMAGVVFLPLLAFGRNTYTPPK